MELKEGDSVELIIGVKVDTGYTVLIEETYEGVLCVEEDEEEAVTLEEGKRLEGYVKFIRENQKIDVSLNPPSGLRIDIKEGDRVDLVIGTYSKLGYAVLINEIYEGLLYTNDVFSDLEEGFKTEGYVKKIRDDQKIDVSLRPQGFRNVIDTDVDVLLSKLKEEGFLLLTDKSSPESIKFHMQMSKKAFKRAVGSLYKEKLIAIEKDRIVLLD